jgi:hypothetical protein
MTLDVSAWDWWVAANERRQVLILRKHSIGLLPHEEPELEILQGLADSIVDMVHPEIREPQGRTLEEKP